MRIKGLLATIGFSAILVMSSLSFTSCNKITEEQLARLQELRKEEGQLRQQISNLSSEIANIEREVKSRKSELDDCTDKVKFVEEKLAKWPNVWPD